MIIVGIDPGEEGGIGIIPLYNFYHTEMYALSGMTLTDVSNLLQQYRSGTSIFNEEEDRMVDTQLEIFLEEPQLPKKNTQNGNNFNVQAHKKLARSLGRLEGVCIANGYPPNLVAPTRWQGSLGCLTKGDKRVTLELAQKIFAHTRESTKKGTIRHKVTHAVADALLIALYGYLQYSTKVPLVVTNAIDVATFQRKMEKRMQKAAPIKPLTANMVPKHLRPTLPIKTK